MITQEIIKERISKLQIEQASLQSSHDKLIREHQQRVARVQEIAQGNVARMHQITGAIAQLTNLLNGQTDADKTPSQ